jgi:hypothetical protein
MNISKTKKKKKKKKTFQTEKKKDFHGDNKRYAPLSH